MLLSEIFVSVFFSPLRNRERVIFSFQFVCVRVECMYVLGCVCVCEYVCVCVCDCVCMAVFVS